MKKLELQDISIRHGECRFQDAQSLQDFAKYHPMTWKENLLLRDARSTVGRKRSFVDIKQFSTYEESQLPLQALECVDKNTIAREVLLLTSPFYPKPSKEAHMVGTDSIWEVKYKLTHRAAGGRALILPEAPTKYEKIAQAIRAYDEQVVALAKENKTISPDIFFYHMEERWILTKDNQREIIECLCSLEASPIWGSLSPTRKKELLSGIRTKLPNKGLEKILQAIASYMTEYELQHDIEKGLGKIMKK